MLKNCVRIPMMERVEQPAARKLKGERTGFSSDGILLCHHGQVSMQIKISIVNK